MNTSHKDTENSQLVERFLASYVSRDTFNYLTPNEQLNLAAVNNSCYAKISQVRDRLSSGMLTIGASV